MILFSTRFALSNDLTRKEFLDMVTAWLLNSKNYTIEPNYQNESDYQIESSDGSEKLIIYSDDIRLALQFIKQDDTAIYTNTYILDDSQDLHVMFVQLTKDLKQAIGKTDVRVNIPKLMRDIFWREYGGMDQNILTDDRVLLIRKNNLSLAESIIGKSVAYLNPIVYVSPVRQTGQYLVNYDRLAADLLGVAHVVVEGSPYISDMVRQLTDSANPYDGAVDVFFPNGVSHRFIRTGDTDFNRCIVDYVRNAVASVAVPDEFSFQKIRFEHLIANMDDNSELSAVCDELIADKERELDNVKTELTETKQALMNAEAHIASLEAGLSVKSSDIKQISLTVTEDDLYSGEIMDVVLKVLQKEFDAIKDDTTLKTSRKYTVLQDILSNNTRTGTDEIVKSSFRELCKDGTFSQEGIRQLERLGFSVSKEANRHFKVAYNGDDRYMTAVSKTPSDHRSGKNLAAAYMNMLFG